MSTVKEIDLEQMGDLRDVSKRIMEFLSKRLKGYLTTASPLFAPRKILGEFMQSAFNERVPGADKHFAEIESRYKTIAKETFGLPSKLDTPVANVPNQLEVYPWEYLHNLDGDSNETVRISSPVKWVLAYASAYTLSDLLEQLVEGEKPEAGDIKPLIVNSLTMWKLIDSAPGLKRLLGDLRFSVSIETAPVSGELPYVVLTSDVPSFRPQDDLIRTVTQFSGKQVFEELIDVDALGDMVDPFSSRLQELKG